MRLGDDPTLQRLARGEVEKCPQCGKPKKAEFKLCRDCAQAAKAGGSGDPSPDDSPVPQKLPDDLVFDSFYDENGKLRQALFFEAASKAAELFEKARVSAKALRTLYQGLQAIARPLMEKRIDFETAKERYGVFYAERVVRQHGRHHLPDVVKDLFDSHKAIVLDNSREMLGLFRYLTNILCYFGDREEVNVR